MQHWAGRNGLSKKQEKIFKFFKCQNNTQFVVRVLGTSSER